MWQAAKPKSGTTVTSRDNEDKYWNSQFDLRFDIQIVPPRRKKRAMNADTEFVYIHNNSSSSAGGERRRRRKKRERKVMYMSTRRALIVAIEKKKVSFTSLLTGTAVARVEQDGK